MTMHDKTRKALIHISSLHESDDYSSVTKTQLWEALKYARHLAKCSLDVEARRAEVTTV
jgi:hypothetical protein